MTERLDTIVIGAGIAGLTYAHARGDADLVVLEAAARPGGLITTHRGDGWHVETGPEALQDNEPEVVALFDELGLAVARADEAARKRYILDTERHLVAVPSSPGEGLRWPLLSFGAKLRAAAGMFRRRDADLTGSLADFVRGRFGPQLLEAVIDPVVSGIWAGDPELISFEAALPRVHDMLTQHGSVVRAMKAAGRERRARKEPRKPPPSLMSAQGGLDALPHAIAAHLGDRLKLERPAERLTREGAGWRVEAGGQSYAARRCVVALPAAAAARLFAQDQPALSQSLGSIHSESVVSVAHIWKRDDLRHPLDAFGYLVPSRLQAMHLGTLFSSSIQPDRAQAGSVVLRSLIGGARHPEMVEASDEVLTSIICDEVGPLLGARSGARPIGVHVTRWPHVLPRYDLDHPRRTATIDGVLNERPGLAVIGNHRRGVAVNALVKASRALAADHA